MTLTERLRARAGAAKQQAAPARYRPRNDRLAAKMRQAQYRASQRANAEPKLPFEHRRLCNTCADERWHEPEYADAPATQCAACGKPFPGAGAPKENDVDKLEKELADAKKRINALEKRMDQAAAVVGQLLAEVGKLRG